MIEAVGNPIASPLIFNEAGIQAAQNMVEEADFRRTTLIAVEEHDMALGGLHGRMLTGAYAEGDEIAALRRSAGYLVAFRLLETGAPSGLVTVGDRLAKGYEARIKADPHALAGDFERDYEGHPLIGQFVDDTLRYEESRYGAMVMFALHGRQANPDRPPILLPTPTDGRTTTQRRQIRRQDGGVSRRGRSGATPRIH